jgi:hypothetical protein
LIQQIIYLDIVWIKVKLGNIEIPEGSYELNQINTEIVRMMIFKGDFDTVNNKSLVDISANLATLRCVVQIHV